MVVSSFEKLGQNDELRDWQVFLRMPFFSSSQVLLDRSDKAKKVVTKLAALARKDSRESFQSWLSESIDQGGGEMHKFIKNETKIEPTIQDENGKFIHDIMQIIEHHTKSWSKHWKVDDEDTANKAIEAIKMLMQKAKEDSKDEHDKRGDYTAEEVRRAAKKFKKKTAIGVDNWSFVCISCMPSPALTKLGKLLRKSKLSMVCPIQVYLNILASLPKKTGDTRTVAIMATYYRLLMELDNQRLEDFEEKHAYCKDSAKKGASAEYAAEERALEAEIKHLLGKSTCTMLWGYRKFFDSIDIQTLIKEAVMVGFPIMELALTLINHLAPRRLKMGKAVGKAVCTFGCSMLAGCKRSTQMARTYTLRFVKKMAKDFAEVTLYQHVDDMTNMIAPLNDSRLAITAIEYAIEFKRQSDKLKLTISDKSTIIPDNEVTRKISRVLNRASIPVKVAECGVDIGVDSSSGTRRTTKKQGERVKEGKRRAARSSILVKYDPRAKTAALTNIDKAQVYGYTAVGASPTTIKSCTKNIAKAAGLGRQGSCSTTAIAWSFRRQHHKHCRSADPRVVMPLGQVRTWMRLWKNADETVKDDIKKVWKIGLRRMADEQARWMRVTGPMSATIATMMDVGWAPVLPNRWLTKDKSAVATFDAKEGITQMHVCHIIENDILDKIWKHAADASCGRGLQTGYPLFEPIAKAHKKLIKEGHTEAAKALITVVTNRSWPGDRLLQEGVVDKEEDAICVRCNEGVDSALHRRWLCKANDCIDHWAIRATKKLKQRATNEFVERACLWLRGLLPHSDLRRQVDWVDEADCEPIVFGNFDAILNKTGVAASDGSGSKEKVKGAAYCGAGVVVIDPETDEVAGIHSLVPGRQTVPRAEVWALWHVMQRMNKDKDFKLIIDASYLVNAMTSGSKWYSEGVNGDLWARIFDEQKKRSGSIELIKAKSHIKEDDWQRYDMTEEKLVMNEAADATANFATEKMARSSDAITADLENLNLAYLIAMRIAVIEADVWLKQPEKDYEAKSNEAVKEKKRQVIKHNLEQEKAAHSLKHSTYIVGRWMRCRHCPATALAEKSIRESTKANGYWKSTPCGKLIERVVCRKLQGTALEYLIYQQPEVFNMAAEDNEDAEKSASSSGLPALPPQTAKVRAKNPLDDSEGECEDEEPFELYDDVPPQTFAELPNPKRVKISAKTPEQDLPHRFYQQKRKFDFDDVQQAAASFRKTGVQEFRKHAEQESRTSKPREVEQVVIGTPEEDVVNEGGWSRVHPSHKRAMVNNVIFCTKCGAWMSSNCRRMGKQCLRTTPYKQAKSQLRRLMSGLYPWKHLTWPDGTPGTVAFPLIRLDNFD